MIVVLGNRNNSVGLPDGNHATTAHMDDAMPLAAAFRNLTDPDGVIANHFTPGSSPAWVASDNEALASLIAQNFDIEVRPLELDEPIPEEVS